MSHNEETLCLLDKKNLPAVSLALIIFTALPQSIISICKLLYAFLFGRSLFSARHISF